MEIYPYKDNIYRRKSHLPQACKQLGLYTGI